MSSSKPDVHVLWLREPPASESRVQVEHFPDSPLRQVSLFLTSILSGAATPPFRLMFRESLLRSAGRTPYLEPELPVDATEAGSIAWEISLPASLAKVWTSSPLERDHDFLHVYSRLSMALQAALRRWVPLLGLSRLEVLDAPEKAWPLLVYRASLVHRPRSRAELTADPLDPRTARRCFHTAGYAVRRTLTSLSSRLRLFGDSKRAASFAELRSRDVIGAVARERGAFLDLLTAEADLIERFLMLALTLGHANRTADTCSRDSVKAVTRFLRTLGLRLRRRGGGPEYLSLAPLLMIEATAALAGSAGAIEERLLFDGRCVRRSAR
jgi:hypothetical protein